MTHLMKTYHDLLQRVLDTGVKRGDRTGTGTLSVFGAQMRFDLQQGFPAITTKKLAFKNTVRELLWFISGSTNISDLHPSVHAWWKPWADDDGDLGPIYGEQFRHSRWYHQKSTPWNNVIATKQVEYDQLQEVIDSVRDNPDSRRHVINLWHTPAMAYTQLPCCHGSIIQFYVAEGKLSCQMYQRSADLFLGVPVNIASYALLTHMVAQCTELEAGEFIHVLGDAHIYLNHVGQVKEQLSRDHYAPPDLELNKNIIGIDDFREADIRLLNYTHHPAIKAPLAI